jgi:hypothetical protein
MTISEQDQNKLVSDVGYEAFQLIVKRMDVLGQVPFQDILAAVVGASVVCLANAVRPGVEASTQRAATADALVASCAKQVRELLEPVVKEAS